MKRRYRRLFCEVLESRHLLSSVSFVKHRVFFEGTVWEPGPLHVADLDGDRDMDVAYVDGRKFVWLENVDGAGTFAEPRIIAEVEHQINSIDVADLDGDGDMDIVAASSFLTAWYENLLDVEGGFGVQHLSKSEELKNVPSNRPWVRAADVDGDGDLDVVSSRERGRGDYDHDIVWFEVSVEYPGAVCGTHSVRELFGKIQQTRDG